MFLVTDGKGHADGDLLGEVKGGDKGELEARKYVLISLQIYGEPRFSMESLWIGQHLL